MPFSFARSAISLPISFAAATLPPVFAFAATVDAETIVTPWLSSITCA